MICPSLSSSLRTIVALYMFRCHGWRGEGHGVTLLDQLTLCHILLGEMLQGRLGNVVSERPWGQPYWIENDLYYLKEEGENEYWGTMNILPQGEGQAVKSDVLSITP